MYDFAVSHNFKTKCEIHFWNLSWASGLKEEHGIKLEKKLIAFVLLFPAGMIYFKFCWTQGEGALL